MTLNDLERRNSLFVFFSPNSIALLAKYVTMVEYRLIISVNIVYQFHSSTFGYNLPTLHRGLSAITELLVLVNFVVLGLFAYFTLHVYIPC